MKWCTHFTAKASRSLRHTPLHVRGFPLNTTVAAGRGVDQWVTKGGIAPAHRSFTSSARCGFPMGTLVAAGRGVWFSKANIPIGTGCGKLTYQGLQGRLLDALGPAPMSHWALQPASDKDEIVHEEINGILDMLADKKPPFMMDSTMTIATCDAEGGLLIRSPIPCTPQLAQQVRSIGTVRYIMAGCLQHWGGVKEWSHEFPEARILITESAGGECLLDKFDEHTKSRVEKVANAPGLEFALLEGAPEMMNETLVFHKASRSLIVDHGFYGGYGNPGSMGPSMPPWFGRIWFKLTKSNWKKAGQPDYVTSRVHSHGSVDQLFGCIDRLAEQWPVEAIIGGHGSGCYQATWSDFSDVWKVGLARTAPEVKSDAGPFAHIPSQPAIPPAFFQQQQRRALATSPRRGMSTSQEKAEKHTPYTPSGQGDGFYSRATKGCFDVVANASDIIMANLPFRDGPEPITIVDYGTADAGTSLLLMGDVVDALRAKQPEKPIQVIYEDQPGNDWASVFNHVSGAISVPGCSETYQNKHKDVLAFAMGRSFYHPNALPGTVDLGICFTAMHWIRSCPMDIPDALHASCTSDPATKAAYAQQAEKDWSDILLQRATEMRKGARFICVNFAMNEQGHYLGTTESKGQMHPSFAEIWRELVTEEEFARTNFANVYRTKEEICAPFASGGGPVVQAGLKLVSCDTRTVRCPFAKAWRDGHYANAAEFAKDFVPTTRTWSNSTFSSGLNNNRTEEEKAALVDELFRRWEKRVELDPAEYHMDYVHTYAVIEKI